MSRMLLGALRQRCGSTSKYFAQAFRLLSDLPDHKVLTMPKLSPTMTSGRLIAWHKAEGDAFAEEEDLADFETDKATMPLTAPEEGFLARIFVPDDTPDLEVGTPIGISVEEEEHIAAFKDYAPSARAASTPAAADPSPAVAAPPVSKPAPTPSSSPAAPYSGHIGPAVARLMNTYPGVDLNRVKATGPKGRILKGDVLAAVEDGSAFGAVAVDSISDVTKSTTGSETSSVASDVEVEYEDIPVSSMRRAITKTVVNSKQTVPHQYATVEFELDQLLALRKRVNNNVSEGKKVSLNDLIIRAVATGLVRVPEMNVTYDAMSGEAVANNAIDISMAVAIPDGLMLPIVGSADQLGLSGIAERTKDLVQRAREGALQPEEYEGGSFGISNLGMFGIENFCAIISPPQSGMLAIGSGEPRLVTDENDELRRVTMGKAVLSSDSRVVGPETASKFLEEFAQSIADPETML